MDALAKKQARADALADAALGDKAVAMEDGMDSDSDSETETTAAAAGSAVAGVEDLDGDGDGDSMRYMRLGAISGRLVASLDVDTMLPQWLRSRGREDEAAAMQVATMIAAANSSAQVAVVQ